MDRKSPILSMRTSDQKTNSRKSGKIIILFTIALLLLGALVVVLVNQTPGDLGKKLKYIGKFSTGCYLVCDSPPSNDYFFETSMSPQELENYFPKMRYVSPKAEGQEQDKYPDDYYSSLENGTQHFVYKYNNSDKYIELDYYKNKKSFVADTGEELKAKGPYFVKIVNYPPWNDYDWFKKAYTK